MNAHSLGKTAEEEPADAASSPDCRKIDVRRYVAEMEHILRTNGDPNACRQALAILKRWQVDEMLDDASRQRAQLLALRFAR